MLLCCPQFLSDSNNFIYTTDGPAPYVAPKDDSAVAAPSSDADGIAVKLDGLSLSIDTIESGRATLFTPSGLTFMTSPTPSRLTLPSAGFYLLSVATPSAHLARPLFARN